MTEYNCPSCKFKNGCESGFVRGKKDDECLNHKPSVEWSDTVSCPHCGRDHEINRRHVICDSHYCQSCNGQFLIWQKVLYKTRKI